MGHRLSSRRGIAALPLLLSGCLLSGCLSLGAGETDPSQQIVQRADLAGGAVVVVPPQGYCIQKQSLKRRPGGGFALLASCQGLTGRVDGYQVEPVVMTVSALPRTTADFAPDASEIEAALGAPKVLRRLHGDGLTIIQVQSDAPLSPEDDPRHWRGMMVINGHIVGLALYAAKGSAATGDKGLSQLMWLAERIREESPPPPQPALLAAEPGNGPVRPRARPGTPTVAATKAPQAKPILGNIFRRIFP